MLTDAHKRHLLKLLERLVRQRQAYLKRQDVGQVLKQHAARQLLLEEQALIALRQELKPPSA